MARRASSSRSSSPSEAPHSLTSVPTRLASRVRTAPNPRVLSGYRWMKHASAAQIAAEQRGGPMEWLPYSTSIGLSLRRDPLNLAADNPSLATNRSRRRRVRAVSRCARGAVRRRQAVVDPVKNGSALDVIVADTTMADWGRLLVLIHSRGGTSWGSGVAGARRPLQLGHHEPRATYRRHHDSATLPERLGG